MELIKDRLNAREQEISTIKSRNKRKPKKLRTGHNTVYQYLCTSLPKIPLEKPLVGHYEEIK